MPDEIQTYVYEPPTGRPMAIRAGAIGQTYHRPPSALGAPPFQRIQRLASSGTTVKRPVAATPSAQTPKASKPSAPRSGKRDGKTGRAAAKKPAPPLTQAELRATVAQLQRGLDALKSDRVTSARSEYAARLDAAFSAPVRGVRVEGTRASFGLHAASSSGAPPASRRTSPAKAAPRVAVDVATRRELDAAFNVGRGRSPEAASTTKKVFAVVDPQAAAERHAVLTGSKRRTPSATILVNNHFWTRQESPVTP